MKRASVALSLIIALAAAPLPAALPPVIGETALPSLAPMIKKVSPAVVNIATRGTIRERGPQNPLLDDPFFRRFFDVPPDTGPRERPVPERRLRRHLRCQEPATSSPTRTSSRTPARSR